MVWHKQAGSEVARRIIVVRVVLFPILAGATDFAIQQTRECHPIFVAVLANASGYPPSHVGMYALALAAARLRTAEEDLARFAEGSQEKEYEIKSKIVILLTDGENNYGKWTPEEAAHLAADWGIKVYTICVGGDEGVGTVKTLFGNFKIPMGTRVDTRPLERVAEITGGIFRRAEDDESLREVYAEIDKLEKSNIESVRYIDYRELFEPFALAALCLLILEVILSTTVFRRIP